MNSTPSRAVPPAKPIHRQLLDALADGIQRIGQIAIRARDGGGYLLCHQEDAADLRLALDHFYPAAVGLWLAWRAGRLEVEHLREKLDRQTGMYRSAKGLTDEEARRLMPAVCSHPHCGRRVLWGLAANQPSDQELSAACSGIHPGVPESEAIPLLCAAPCNHFVAECLNAVRQRSRQNPSPLPPAT